LADREDAGGGPENGIGGTLNEKNSKKNFAESEKFFLPGPSRLWIVSDGKAGDEAQCLGIAETLSPDIEMRRLRPRWPFTLLMPRGPIDPRDRLTPEEERQLPDIAIAAGRRTVNFLKYLKAKAPDRLFTVFVKDPYVGRDAADVIWVPTHDRLRGSNVIVTKTPAHRISASALAAARKNPDFWLSGLSAPRLLVIVGGPSQHHRFGKAERDELLLILTIGIAAGFSLMVTGSRRTPPDVMRAIESFLRQQIPSKAYVWDGEGEDPYVSMLATADQIVVTGDSVNMIAESVATGVPVHVYEPSGGHPKITAYIEMLVQLGALRRWTRTFSSWSYEPIDATPKIAEEIARRYMAWRSERGF